jgi:4Fe-4S ferredoxin
MPLKTVKKESTDLLSLEWILHVKNYRLDLDKNRCAGCQICSLACPKEAIHAEKQPKAKGEKAKKARIDINLQKCNFCGICDVLCPYGAVKVTVDGQHILSVVEKESFPQLARDIQIDTTKYPLTSLKWDEACPLNLIQLSTQTIDGRPKVDVQKDYCPSCRICEIKLPEGVAHVSRLIYGKLTINDDRCPQGCRDCLDVCPINGALYVSDSDGKVHVDERFCVYCGACKITCPVEEAMDLKRTKISHTAVRSGAWNKALERLTSPVEMTKELKSKGSTKARESVKNRVGLGEKKNA